jgi:hypothetical protein
MWLETVPKIEGSGCWWQLNKARTKKAKLTGVDQAKNRRQKQAIVSVLE